MKFFYSILIIMFFSITTYGKDLTIIPSEDDFSLEFLLQGKNENCKFSIGDGRSFYKGSCLELKNNQNITIICTPQKSICKTEDEIYNVANAPIMQDSAGYKVTSPKKNSILEITDIFLDYNKM